MNQVLDNAIKQIMDSFSKKRTVFFNEADFQNNFVKELMNILNSNEFKLTLEYSPNFNKYRVDLLIEDLKLNENIIVEFKYVVKKNLIEISSNFFINLKDQGAYDIRRYKIWKDIEKIEKLKNNKKCDYGYFILLTNADKLINPVPINNIDSYFDISSGIKRPSSVPASLFWNPNSKKYDSGKTKTRYPNVININNQYDFIYTPYKSNNNFKFCIISVK